jgi:hypothetical protein
MLGPEIGFVGLRVALAGTQPAKSGFWFPLLLRWTSHW